MFDPLKELDRERRLTPIKFVDKDDDRLFLCGRELF
jgi:hypothetical protein